MANNFRPSVRAIDQDVDLDRAISASTLFEYLDLDGDPLQRVRFFDSNNDPRSGYFTVGGNRMSAGQWFEVDVSKLHTVIYRAGIIVGNEVADILVYDGEFWSSPATVRINTVEPNVHTPVVTTTDVSVLGNESIIANTMFDATDADGDPITRYRVRDQKTNVNSGAFFLNGVKQTQGTTFEITAGERNQLRYFGGINNQTEKFFVQAFDGEKWGAVKSGNVETERNRFRPVIEAIDRSMKTDSIVDAGSLFSYSDPDGNSIKEFSFYDSGSLQDGGFFSVNGIRQTSRQWFTVKTSDVVAGNVKYHSAKVFDSERIRVQVSDGRFKSEVKTFDIRTIVTPDLDGTNFVQIVNDSTNVDVRTWVNQVDNGPQISTWQFFDASSELDSFGAELTGSLRFQGNILAPQRIRQFTTAELGSLTFKSGVADRGVEYDEIYIRGHNGDEWSTWERINVTSIFNAENALLQAGGAGPGKWGSPQFGTGVTLTYSFMEEVPAHYFPVPCDEATSPFMTYPPEIRAAMRNVLQDLENKFGIDFVEVSESVPANLEFGMTDNIGGGTIAYNYFPGPLDATGCSTTPQVGWPTNATGHHSGDGWLEFEFAYDGGGSSSPLGWFGPGAVDKGSDLYNTLIHEVMHGLGIHHPFDQGTGDDALRPQVENVDWTIMSYNNTSSWSQASPFEKSAATTQLFDNYVLGRMYGYNTEYNKEDTVYHYRPNEHSQYSETIYDPGGIDILNLSNYTFDSTIDLREGHHSSVGGSINNLNISFGTVIENVVGGTGNDVITGNEFDNRIRGGIGNDTIASMGGRDIAFGQEGNDTYQYSLGDGTLIVNELLGGGRDTIEIFSFNDDFDVFEQDLSFRVKNGTDLIISLSIDGGRSEGTIAIKDMKKGASRIETLRIFDSKRDQIGPDISLNSVFLQATNKSQQFVTTQFEDQFGTLAVPS